jgi:quercetin dioxygenase-like cupin family protein
MKPKLMSAGALITLAIGLLAWRVAWATPGAGITTTILSGPVEFGDLKVKSESDINEIEIEMKGSSDVYIVHNVIVPGGHTGWHSHPGISFVTVRAGTATEYSGDDPNTPNVYVAGSGFVEESGHVHIIRNEGTTNLELVAFQIVPKGAVRRIDKPQP